MTRTSKPVPASIASYERPPTTTVEVEGVGDDDDDAPRKRRDHREYNRARYVQNRETVEWVRAGRPSEWVLNTGRKRDARSAQRPDESDAAYLKRIHRAASRLHKHDPAKCREWYPAWAPKQRQTPEERAVKQHESQKRLYAARKRERLQDWDEGKR